MFIERFPNRWVNAVRFARDFLIDNEQYDDDWHEEIQAMDEMLDVFINKYPLSSCEKIDIEDCVQYLDDETEKYFLDSDENTKQKIIDKTISKLQDRYLETFIEDCTDVLWFAINDEIEEGH